MIFCFKDDKFVHEEIECSRKYKCQEIADNNVPFSYPLYAEQGCQFNKESSEACGIITDETFKKISLLKIAHSVVPHKEEGQNIVCEDCALE